LKAIIVLFFFIFLYGCPEPNPSPEPRHQEDGSIWICYQTGEICSSDCYVTGDSRHFCFEVTPEDCNEINLDWQRLYCPLLEA